MASKENEAMQVADILHMNSATEESSYATNSFLQEIAIRKVHSILKETIKGIANIDGFPKCFNIADLGCASGPNTLLAISNIINEVHAVCKEKNLIVPQFQVCLNDLFGNDFNSIFKSLPTFYDKLNKEKGEKNNACYVSAAPGSFHGRLFPDRSMHFFHSSTSLHWLSQVPLDIENNKLNIYISKASPPDVFEKYRMQFQKDFTTFLQSRSIEIIHGGRMVLSLFGRSSVDPYTNDNVRLSELVAKSLVDLVNEGLVRESDLISFNIPLYNPCIDEVKDIIYNEGSFSLDILDSFELNWDPNDNDSENVKVFDEPKHGKAAVKITRAVSEPLLVTHFGKSAMNLLFEKLENYIDAHLAIEKTKYFNIVLSMTKI